MNSPGRTINDTRMRVMALDQLWGKRAPHHTAPPAGSRAAVRKRRGDRGDELRAMEVSGADGSGSTHCCLVRRRPQRPVKEQWIDVESSV